LIENRDNGVAISGNALSLINGSDGVIRTAGPTAVRAANLTLSNRGVIDGSVIVSNSSDPSSIDSTNGGSINGDVLLGDADDMIVASFANNTLETGVHGILDAGGGIDTLRLNFYTDQSIGTETTLPATIEQLSLGIYYNATVTLERNFRIGSTLHTAPASYGTLLNLADITTVGPAIIADIFSGVTVNNQGTVVANLADSNDAAIRINAYGHLINGGAIDGRGGLGIKSNSGTFDNMGTVMADQTAVTLFDVQSSNSGVIWSRGGAGLETNGSVGITFANSGRIEGATAGAITSIFIDNSGMIAGEDNGVVLNPYGGLYNRSTGVITGGNRGIGPGIYGYTFNAKVFNAGTINGNVDLGTCPSFYGSNNVFAALPGGTLNGDLHLGSGNDTLLVSINNTGLGEFAGITGSVSGGGFETLRYIVDQDFTATLALTGIFSAVGYELTDGKTLTLNAPSPQSLNVDFAGHGKVNLMADLNGSGGRPIVNLQAAPLLIDPLQPYPAGGVEMTNYGTLSVIQSDPFEFTAPAVVLGKDDIFTNNGIITVQDLAPDAAHPLVAAMGKGTIINNGIIRLDNANAIVANGYGRLFVDNSGTIEQLENDSLSLGIIGAHSVLNTGKIKTGGIAVYISGDSDGFGTLINSGAIQSLNGPAIYGTSVFIINEDKGLIATSTDGTSIQAVSGSVVSNAGHIEGDVIVSGYYINRGGTLDGNLTLTQGGNILVTDGLETGISGEISTNFDSNIVVRSFSSSASIEADDLSLAGFQFQGVEALGEEAEVLMKGEVSSLQLFGTGTIYNHVTVTGAASFPGTIWLRPSISEENQGALSFINYGMVAGNITGPARNFDNHNTVGNITGDITSVFLRASSDQSFHFSNSGVISSTGRLTVEGEISNRSVQDAVAVRIEPSLNYKIPTAAIIDNTGEISGGITAILYSNEISFENHGVINRSSSDASAVSVSVFLPSDETYYMTVKNSGRIDALGNNSSALTLGSIFPLTSCCGGGGIVISPTRPPTIFTQENQQQSLSFEKSAINLLNSGTISAIGENAFAIDTEGADLALRNEGSITGTVRTGSFNDTIQNFGTINGNITLGDGDDRFDFHIGSSLTGSADGGADSDQIALYLDSGDGLSQRIDLAPYSNFERLSVEAGVGTIDGTINFDTITVNTGRLIGLAGSTINAPGGITVAPTGTFGSAGTVNADISVAGMLSPGASPGTMTVNGDVTLASGSTALFEVTPTVSDALIINGALTIANGVTLTITGSRPLTPGTTLDLIAASDGITGDFDTVTSSLGFVRQSGSGVSLLGQFVLPTTGTGSQSTNTAQYINDLIINGTASAGLLAAAPALLLPSGFANPAAIARLSPEAYASALQIGLENGLALSTATRAVALGENIEDKRFFGFGQVLGAWRRLPGNADMGTSGANVRSSGLLGGIGFGSEHFAIGAFIGRIDASQTLSELGAKNDVDGTVFGALATARSGALDLSVAIARDGSSGEATREGIAGQAASGAYSLHGWVVDMSAGYRLQVGQDWSIRPQVSFTRVETRRSRVTETGAGPLDLEVDAHRTKADFIGGKIAFGASPSKTIRPWVGIGLRHQLNGRRTTATARFLGNAESFTVAGATRSATLATIDGGISADIGHNVTLFANGHSEFGADSSGESAMIGAKLGF